MVPLLRLRTQSGLAPCTRTGSTPALDERPSYASALPSATLQHNNHPSAPPPPRPTANTPNTQPTANPLKEATDDPHVEDTRPSPSKRSPSKSPPHPAQHQPPTTVPSYLHSTLLPRTPTTTEAAPSQHLPQEDTKKTPPQPLPPPQKEAQTPASDTPSPGHHEEPPEKQPTTTVSHPPAPPADRPEHQPHAPDPASDPPNGYRIPPRVTNTATTPHTPTNQPTDHPSTESITQLLPTTPYPSKQPEGRCTVPRPMNHVVLAAPNPSFSCPPLHPPISQPINPSIPGTPAPPHLPEGSYDVTKVPRRSDPPANQPMCFKMSRWHPMVRSERPWLPVDACSNHVPPQPESVVVRSSNPIPQVKVSVSFRVRFVRSKTSSPGFSRVQGGVIRPISPGLNKQHGFISGLQDITTGFLNVGHIHDQKFSNISKTVKRTNVETPDILLDTIEKSDIAFRSSDPSSPRRVSRTQKTSPKDKYRTANASLLKEDLHSTISAFNNSRLLVPFDTQLIEGFDNEKLYQAINKKFDSVMHPAIKLLWQQTILLGVANSSHLHLSPTRTHTARSNNLLHALYQHKQFVLTNYTTSSTLSTPLSSDPDSSLPPLQPRIQSLCAALETPHQYMDTDVCVGPRSHQPGEKVLDIKIKDNPNCLVVCFVQPGIRFHNGTHYPDSTSWIGKSKKYPPTFAIRFTGSPLAIYNPSIIFVFGLGNLSSWNWNLGSTPPK
ncbi:hypothetical protein BDK51DRAFT_52893 [Blyttiomyces helicus]|uniref:DUF7869 domain-containing protein n=1 Tax=Blyttiomyces helicus TaxID=388810 RepID=A0A4P9WQX6_9FUNG|nr:hypothetical protein BDK51DRAFT_52893 [Blyttiomyces helicus]|eukprot:RKO94603.1 hypothetical protein BDK51DRAFT_52893 [Blyttiomyces helicus]